jgi:hypothetical protein
MTGYNDLMDSADIYGMKLHETIILFNNNATTHSILRVAGGWIYQFSYDTYATSTFVPFDNEFQSKK